MADERLLSTRQAAELLSVSTRTVTNWIRADRVPYVRLPGGEYRLPVEGLLDSLTGTHDMRAQLEAATELDAGAQERAAHAGRLTMSERLAHVHELSRQMTAIAGRARRDGD